MKPNQNRFGSIRDRIGRGSASSVGQAQRRSRRDQEARYQRLFMLSMIGLVGLIVLILGGGTIYEYVVKPNAVIAEVNGTEIKRRDYWKYQSIVLYNQARQYESFATQTQGDQQQQFLQFAASFDAQRNDVWGSTDVSAPTVQQMVDDQLYLDGAEALGVAVSDEEATRYALNQFSPPDAPLLTPQPSPTLIPERAQAATETAEALATEQSIALGTPVASPVASPGAGAPQATPVTGSGTPAATPVTDVPPTPAADATPNLDDSLRAAEAEYEIFQDNVFEEANMSEGDYIRLWARPQMVRQQVVYQLTNQVPQTAEQLNAQHILVSTEDLANQLYEQATGGAEFGALARSNSTDTATAATGGELGWFTRLEVDPALADAAFALQPLAISEPVQTGFGWQIVKVNEKQAERPLTDAQYQLATDDAIETWLEAQREQADISSEYETTPTVTPGAFAPPAGAPTPIQATPIPASPTPVEPIVGPQPVAPGSPAAATPAGAAIGSPAPTAGTPAVEATPAS